jgi:hypothetical protein
MFAVSRSRNQKQDLAAGVSAPLPLAVGFSKIDDQAGTSCFFSLTHERVNRTRPTFHQSLTGRKSKQNKAFFSLKGSSNSEEGEYCPFELLSLLFSITINQWRNAPPHISPKKGLV